MATIYGQYPPLVNPTRAPGEWQVYVAPGGGGPSRPVRAIPTAVDRLWITGRAAELALTRDANGVVTAISEVGSNAAPAVRRDASP